jgi:uncharacterized protein YoxC
VIGFLTVVTIVYALILVVVVAVSLVVIGRVLWSVGTTLGKISGGLTVVERQTAPLGGYVDALNEGLGSVSTELTSVAGHLSDADDELAMAMGEAVAGKPTSNVA